MTNTIRVERTRHDLTQQDLADRTSVSRQTINAIEAGRYIPSTVLALKIAAIFQTNVNDLFHLEEND